MDIEKTQLGNILVVDDDIDGLLLLVRLLRKEGYHVREAKTGEEAIDSIKALPPDLVLLDIKLPYLSGYEVCEKLKEDETTRDVPVIFISALNETQNKTKGFKVGGIDYLTKPYDKDEILARVHTHVSMSHIRKERQQFEASNAMISATSLNMLEDLKEEVEQRKKIESALIESEENLRQGELVAKFGNWKLDLLTNILYASVGTQKIFGIEKSEVSMEEVKSYRLPEYNSLMDTSLNDLIKNNKPYNLEYKIKRKNDGKIIDIHSKAIYDANTQTLFGIIQDITDRKAAEKKVHEKDLQFKKISDNVPDLLFQFTRKPDGSYCVPIASAGIKNIFGCTPEEVVDDFTPIGKVIFPEDAERVISDIEFSAKNLSPFTCEFRVQIPGKAIQWILSKSKPEKLADGSITWYGFNSDITERKQSVMELMKLNLAIDSSSEAIFLTDKDGIITFINKGFTAIYGFTPAEVVGKNTPRILKSDLYDTRYYADFWKALLSGRELKGEYINKTKDGSRIDIEGSASPIFDNQNNIMGFLGIQYNITERIKVQDALRKSETFLKETQTIAQLGTYTLDIIGGKWECSEILEKIFGIDSHYDWSFEGWISIIHPDWHKGMNEFFIQQLAEKSHKYEIEYKIIRQDDKEVRWVHEIGEIKINELEQPILLVGIVSDITVRKIAEEKINHLSQAVEQSPITIVITDTQGGIQYANATFTQTTGFSLEESKSKKLRILDAGNNKTDDFEKMWNNISSGNKWTGEFYNQKKNGEFYWESVMISPIMDAEGEIQNYLAIKTDITNRKLNDEKLKNSEERFRSVTQSANDAIISANSKGFIIGWNQGAERIFGYSEEEIMGNRLDAIIPAKYQQDHHKGIDRLGNIGEPRIMGKTVEVEGRNKNGEIFPIELSLANWNTAEGTFYTAIIRDITDRKKAELLQIKITNDLIQRNKDLEQFTYIVSHNLRAPVANIKGFNDIILNMELSPEELQEIITGISKSVNKLDTVISDLNEILNLKNNITEKKQLVFFQELVDTIVSADPRLIEGEKFKVLTDFSQIDHMNTLKSYLYSIFHNLISNSVKYSRPDVNTKIEITSKMEGNKIEILFKDNGLGFDMEKSGDKVFGLYKRFHQHIEGKGLGLFMVKTQVETLGGKISLKSELNKGSEFLIEISI